MRMARKEWLERNGGGIVEFESAPFEFFYGYRLSGLLGFYFMALEVS